MPNPDRLRPSWALLLLAGGQSRRTAPHHKALVPVSGKPLLLHLVDQFAGLAPGRCALSTGPDANFHRQLSSLPLPSHWTTLADSHSDHCGPLAGIAAGLAWLAHTGYDWLAVCPVDCPHASPSLFDDLHQAAEASGSEVISATDHTGERSLISLWHRQCLGTVERALARHQYAIHRCLAELQATQWALTASDAWQLHNLNDPASLAAFAAQCASRPSALPTSADET
jgi:molybdenum cofactor guanylyltransferase